MIVISAPSISELYFNTRYTMRLHKSRSCVLILENDDHFTKTPREVSVDYTRYMREATGTPLITNPGNIATLACSIRYK